MKDNVIKLVRIIRLKMRMTYFVEWLPTQNMCNTIRLIIYHVELFDLLRKIKWLIFLTFEI